MWIDILSGGLVGFVVGATGIGGGAIMTPLLLIGYGMPVAHAIGTDLMYATGTKIAVAYSYNKHGSVDWKITCLLSAGSIPATLLVMSFWPVAPEHLTIIGSRALGCVLLATVVAIIYRPNKSISTPESMVKPTSSTKLVISGILVGILVSISSIGAGVIATVLLMYMLPHFPIIKIIGTELSHAVLLTAVAGLCHAKLGHVDWQLVGNLLIGSVPAAFIGSKFAHGNYSKILKPLILGLLSISGIRLVLIGV